MKFRRNYSELRFSTISYSFLKPECLPECPTKDPRKAYGILKAWYRYTGDRPHKATQCDPDKVASNFSTLYTQEHPSSLEDDIPPMVAPFDIDGSIPNEPKIETAVKRLRLHKAPGPSGMTVQNMRDWLEAATCKTNPDPTPWLALVDLIQHIFRTGDVPTPMCWSYMTLLPKLGGGVRGI